ncbi:copper-binding protein [uncultured Roseobacter sp.]|uniref:copper-binding protein n=1 Tax=uncultured Roseobacter sp. TaxID=114847 RepID=UPI00260D2552|nr:copper-binding protein [uncultured Roseobacter sp.]
MTRRPTRRSVMVGTAAMAAVPVPITLLADIGKVHEVEIRSFEFNPGLIQVRVGDMIRWSNKDLAPHTATADQFGWNTGALEKDAVGEVWVTDGMETTYFCAFHPHMKGRIEITH